tara:strand:+ start:1851 stop:2732 length:882 start_codon:yes stop_codon:yes gene_type:complete
MKSHLIIQGPFFSDSRVSTEKSIITAIESGIFSKITLSTYDHPDIEDLRKSYSIEVIINKDPGSQGREIYRKKYQNINRQIKTLTSGVIVNEFDYSMKMRSDCYIYQANKLKSVINDFMTSNKTFLLTDSSSVRFDTGHPRTLYHLSDWFIGFKKEKSKLVKSIPYIDEKYNESWLNEQSDELKGLYDRKKLSTRFGAEVWITLNLLSKANYPINHCLDYSNKAEEQFINDLKQVMCVPMYTMGMRCMKMRSVHIPHLDRYENYLGRSEKIIYKIIGLFYKIYAKLRQKYINN